MSPLLAIPPVRAGVSAAPVACRTMVAPVAAAVVAAVGVPVGPAVVAEAMVYSHTLENLVASGPTVTMADWAEPELEAVSAKMADKVVSASITAPLQPMAVTAVPSAARAGQANPGGMLLAVSVVFMVLEGSVHLSPIRAVSVALAAWLDGTARVAAWARLVMLAAGVAAEATKAAAS